MAPIDASDRFASTEEYYARHRPGYGDAAVRHLCQRFALDDSARVLDLGCGAGQITVPLAAHAGEVVGMDPNEAMLREARRRAEAAGIENVEWVVGSDSDLSDDLGTVRLTAMGRSFHWMDQEATLDRLYRMTERGGGVALLDDPEWLTRGTREWQAAVYELVDEYLDDVPDRTGPVDDYDDPWDETVAASQFDDVETATFEVERDWTVDSVVGYVFSLSFCSPATFGDDRAAFESAVRDRLRGRDRETFVQNAEVTVISARK